MTETLSSIVQQIIFSLTFVAMCLLSRKYNLKKENRYKQVYMPAFALLYCIVAMIFLTDLSDKLLGIVYSLIEKVGFLGFLDNVNWAYMATYLVNTALITGFMVVKSVLFPVVTGLSFIPGLTEKLVEPFYFKKEVLDDEESDKKSGKKNGKKKSKKSSKKASGTDNKKVKTAYYIKDKFGDLRRILNAMYFAMLALFTLLMVVTYYLTSQDVFSAPFYPSFGVLVLGEIVFFLCGKTYTEKKAEEKEPEEEEVQPEIDYDDFVPKYEETLGKRLMLANPEPAIANMDESVAGLLDKYRKEYEKTLNQEANLMCTFYSALEANGVVLDEGYLCHTRSILDGKSVLFFTQFYDDTTNYVFLPIVRHLMRSKKILVILGRNGGEDNITEWLERGISGVTNMTGIWKINLLADAGDDTSVAILDAKNIYNQKLLNAKEDFLSNSSMVIIVEPNRLLGTIQIGLSCLVNYLRKDGNDPQYIIYDRNCDGLVDSLSHVLNKSLEHVSATSIGTAKKNTLFWKADGSMLHYKLGLNSSRYLGVGTELALVALREHASKVVWASSGKFPVVDMRWIANQYYASLCAVIGLKVSQNELASHLEYCSDPWSIPQTENSIIVAEDEFNNAFEIARQFTTRGTGQSFVNVISSDYWLRNYMIDNMDIFRNDPKSIPNITPDYQRSIGNIVYKLLLRMIEGPVEENDVRDALEMIGEDTENIYNSLRALIIRYFFRDVDKDQREIAASKIDNAVSISTMTVADPKTMRVERKRFFSITNRQFVDTVLSQLKIVYYIAEDEKDKDNFLDSAMYGHVYQKYLPGMFTTLDGKYYEVISMTKSSGVIVRRAADHINSRHYYRSLRKYIINPREARDVVGSIHTYGDISFERLEADIHVDTYGYFDMADFRDIKNAKKVLINNIDPRDYRNKEIIRVRMAGSTKATRATVAALLNELFVTVFPDNYQYIVATADCDHPESVEGILPELEGGDGESIYIIEDSLIDLGLLINVDRYFVRFMQIICDGLVWHQEKLAEENEAPIEEPEIPDEIDDEPEEEKPKRGIKGLIEKIKRLFKRKKKKKGDDTSGGDDGLMGPGDGFDDPIPTDDDPFDEPIPTEDPEFDFDSTPLQNRMDMSKLHKNAGRRGVILRDYIDDSGIEGDDSDSISAEDLQKKQQDEEELPYSQSFYLLYGFDSVPAALDIDGTVEYLKGQGLAENYLKQGRDNGKFERMKWYNYHFEPGVHYCDFCGAPMEDDFDILDDGRERCPECSKTAIVKVKDFKKLYKKTRKQMEEIFGIKLKAKVRIKMCNAETIAAQFGETFVSTPGFDGRTLGFASSAGMGYDIFIENGAPSIESEKTLVHEMTHLWQYENLPDLFQGNRDLIPIEGMAVWTEVQYLTSMNMPDRALAYQNNRLCQDNEYGNGLREYLSKYPIRQKPTVHHKTPFTCKHNPLK